MSFSLSCPAAVPSAPLCWPSACAPKSLPRRSPSGAIPSDCRPASALPPARAARPSSSCAKQRRRSALHAAPGPKPSIAVPDVRNPCPRPSLSSRRFPATICSPGSKKREATSQKLKADVLQEFLEYVVRNHPATRAQAEPPSLARQRSLALQPFCNVEGYLCQIPPELPGQRIGIHSRVLPQAKKPCFFELTVWAQPFRLRGLSAGKVALEIVGCRRTQNIVTFAGRQHARRIQPQPKVRTPLPVAQVLSRLESRPGKVRDLVCRLLLEKK